MKPTRGYITADGRFYSSKEGATYHEAQLSLTHTIQTADNIDAGSLINAIKKHPEEIYACVKAWLAYEKRNTAEAKPKPAPADQEDDDGGEDQPETVEQQSSSRSEPMPHIRARKRREAILRDGPSDGPRSGGANARSVRRRPHMATGSETES